MITGCGAIGMLRGAEENQRYQLDADGIPRALAPPRFWKQAVEKVSADDGDIHRVSNALADRALSAFMSTAAISAR